MTDWTIRIPFRDRSEPLVDVAGTPTRSDKTTGVACESS